MPVRRGSVTITDCDRELTILRRRLRMSLDPEEKEILRLDIDRWLDLRYDLACQRDRMNRSLG